MTQHIPHEISEVESGFYKWHVLVFIQILGHNAQDALFKPCIVFHLHESVIGGVGEEGGGKITKTKK